MTAVCPIWSRGLREVGLFRCLLLAARPVLLPCVAPRTGCPSLRGFEGWAFVLRDEKILAPPRLNASLNGSFRNGSPLKFSRATVFSIVTPGAPFLELFARSGVFKVAPLGAFD